jgi:hypothetical protein
MKLVSVFPALRSIHPTRLADIKTLNLPSELSLEIERTINTNRMLFEPWIQSANNYQELKESLKRRGYKNLPISMSPMHEPRPVSSDKPKTTPKTSHLVTRNTMLRRASRPS